MSLTIPPYIPPVTGAGTLNGQKELSRQVKTIAAASTTIPVIYGEAQVGGRVFAATFTGGFWYIGALFCVGEIDSFTALYLDGVDVKPATPDGMTITYYTGTTSQTADATLASAISGYTDTLVVTNGGGSVGLAYVVLKYNESHYAGFPTIMAKIKGRKVFASSENVMLRSQELDNASWVQTNTIDIDVTPNATTAPDGTATADKLIEITTTSTTRWLYKNISLNDIPSNAEATLSGYFKSAERTAVRFLLRNKANNYHGYIFDLASQTATVSSGTPASGGIISVGNGWYRCWVTINILSGAAVPIARIQMVSGTSNLTYAGEENSGFFAWGIQLEPAASMGVYSATAATKTAAAWSDNPAYCLNDLIRNRVFGLGEDVDALSVQCAATECDALVTTEKRRTLNLVIDSARSATDWIDTLATYAGAWAFKSGARWVLKPDRPAFLWQFTSTDGGWTGTRLTLTTGATALTITATATDPVLRSPTGLNINGRSHRYVRARVRRTVGAGTWDGVVYYATDFHGETGNANKVIAAPTVANGTWVTLEWDMHNLSNGGQDWQESVINFFRIDLSQTGTDVWEVDWIAVGIDPITTADVLAGSFTAGTADAAQVPTVLRIDYTDASTTEYKTRPAYAELAGVSTGAIPRRESNVSLPGVTRYSQAFREAAERLAKLNNSLYCEFTRFDEGLATEVGDVLSVMHPYVDTASTTECAEATLFLVTDAKVISPGRVRVRATKYDTADYDNSENTATWGAYTRRAGNLRGSGDGINRIQPRFAGGFVNVDYDGQFPVFKQASVQYASVTSGSAPDPTAGYYGTYALKITTISTGTLRTVWFGSSATTYTMPIDPNSKWLFSCKFWPRVADTAVDFRLKTSAAGTQYVLTDTTSTAEAWNDFVDTSSGSNLLNCVSDASTLATCGLSVKANSTAVWFDGIMLEKQIGGGAIVSPWRPPVASAVNPARITPRLVAPGLLDDSVSIDDGNGNSKVIVAGVLSGTVTDGQSITFSPAFLRVPIVQFNPTALTYNSAYSASSHALVCEARSLTVSGFTAYLKVRQLAATITARTDTTPTDAGSGVTPRYTIQKAASALEAWDDRYKFAFDVVVKNDVLFEPFWGSGVTYSPGSVTVGVYIATADSGATLYTPTWTLVGSITVGGLGGSSPTTSRTGQTVTVTRDGLTQRGGSCPEFGIAITSELVSGGTVTFTNVTYSTATAPTETSATAAGISPVSYTVIPQ